MDFIKKYPGFVGAIVVCVLLTAAQVVFIFLQLGSRDEAQSDYKRVLSQSRQVVSLSPRPTEDNVKSSEQNIEELEAAQAEAIREIEGNSGEIAPEAEVSMIDSSDLFFRLQSYIEDFRQKGNKVRMEQAVVDGERTERENPYLTLPENMTFGFGYFTETGKGPEPRFIEQVYIQHRVLAFLMEKLFESEPESIEQVLRDPITVELVQTDDRGRTKIIDPPTDTFMIDPMISAREEGVIGTYAFKIVFTGYTKNLRYFLNSLDEFGWPLVVRSVEARPADVDNSKSNKKRNNRAAGQDLMAMLGGGGGEEEPSEEVMEQAKAPVVENNVTEFTVIVELIEVISQKTEQDQEGAQK